MPELARRSGGIEAWVIVAGWEIRLSTPPRLSARPSAHPVEQRLGRLELAHVDG